MRKKGVILQLYKYNAVVFSDNGTYEKISRVKGMFEGQLIAYDDSIGKKSRLHFSIAAAVIIVVLITYLVFLRFAPTQVYAFIDIDINPSIELSVDEDIVIRSIRPINPAAQEITEKLDIIDMKLLEAIPLILEESEAEGYLSKQDKSLILISTSMNSSKSKVDKHTESNKKLDSLLSDLKTTIVVNSRLKIRVETVQATEDQKKLSEEYGMSMGRYILYTNAVKSGSRLSVEDAVNTPLKDLISNLYESPKNGINQNIGSKEESKNTIEYPSRELEKTPEMSEPELIQKEDGYNKNQSKEEGNPKPVPKSKILNEVGNSNTDEKVNGGETPGTTGQTESSGEREQGKKETNTEQSESSKNQQNQEASTDQNNGSGGQQSEGTNINQSEGSGGQQDIKINPDDSDGTGGLRNGRPDTNRNDNSSQSNAVPGSGGPKNKQ